MKAKTALYRIFILLSLTTLLLLANLLVRTIFYWPVAVLLPEVLPVLLVICLGIPVLLHALVGHRYMAELSPLYFMYGLLLGLAAVHFPGEEDWSFLMMSGCLGSIMVIQLWYDHKKQLLLWLRRLKKRVA